jgi:hypothetical protein
MTRLNTRTTYLSCRTNLLGFGNELYAASNHPARLNDFSILTLRFTIYLTFSVIVFVQNIIVALGQVRLQNGIAQLLEILTLSFCDFES